MIRLASHLLIAVLPLLATAAAAQTTEAPTGTSKPQPAPLVDAIPPPRDRPYPGTIRLAVDASDTVHGIMRVKETIPAAPGPLTLLYPKWLPGDHAPSGTISKLAGLVVTAGGRPVPWRRDPIDVFAFHVDVPTGATGVDVSFQFLSPTADNQGRTQVTPRLISLEWNELALYPAGWFVRDIPVRPSVTWPAGWTAATALRPIAGAPAQGGTIDYQPVAFDTLIDSPAIAGRYARIERLSPDVTLDIMADGPADLAATPEQLAAHRALVTQAVRLFGAQHYNHYDFLFTLSDTLGGAGLEHHRSSEDGTGADYFTEWDSSVAGRDLLAHEFTHSWNGKFRRPAELWTPDYRQPMGPGLLWVYEGQTQFWGNVLAARAGLVSKDQALDALAGVAAVYSTEAGRAWRPLADTTLEEIIGGRAPAPWPDWQRPEDYYQEGQLIWLDADSLIRERSHGRRSLDDFARAFFGVRDRDWGELTYTFDDVVAALNAVEPFDWATFLHERVDAVALKAPLDGIARGGYRLVYTADPGKFWKAREGQRKILDLSYSLGISVGKEGVVSRVQWNSPGFDAGLTIGTKLVAVDGIAYSDEALKRAVTAAKDGAAPIPLTIQQRGMVRTVAVKWSGGLRYPHLERTGKGPSTLDALYAPRG